MTFYMARPKPHRVRDRRGVWIATGLFKVTFFSSPLPDTDDGMPCWYQASALVANLKEARAAAAAWVAKTKEYDGA